MIKVKDFKTLLALPNHSPEELALVEDENKVYVYKDGVAQTGHVYDYSQSTIQFIFQITSSTSSFEFKDYILYPI